MASGSETVEINDTSDSISLTSTVDSEQLTEYEVEDILAERYHDGYKQYLVKWVNYPLHRCTWEPASSFDTADTLVDWKKRKEAIAEGRRKAFDLESWENYIERLAQDHDERRRRREAKRKKLALATDAKSMSTSLPAAPMDISAGSNRERNLSTPYLVSDEAFALFVPAASPPLSRKLPGASPSQQQPLKDSVSRAAAPISNQHALSESGQGLQSTIQRPHPSQEAQPSTHSHSSPPVKRAPPAEFGVSDPGRPHKQSRWDEIPPDVSQLQLMKPSEFPARTGHKTTAILTPTKSPAGAHDSPEAPGQPSASSDSLSKPSNQEAISQTDMSSTRPIAPIGTSSSALPRRLRDPERPERPSDPLGRRESIRRTADCYRPYRSRSPRSSRRHGLNVDPSLSTPSALHSSREHDHHSPEERISRMPVGKRTKAAMYTSNGYFWNPGEVLAHLYFGPEKTYIGAARLCGVPAAAKTELLGSKSRQTRLEIWFRYLCTYDEYGTLCQGTANIFWCNSWMEGFLDSNPAIFHMAEQLRERGLIAIYYPPDSRWNVWLAYSRQSKEFNFLNKNTGNVPDGAPMFLAVRSALASIEQLSIRDRMRPTDTPKVLSPNSPLEEPRNRSDAYMDSAGISGVSPTVPFASPEPAQSRRPTPPLPAHSHQAVLRSGSSVSVDQRTPEKGTQVATDPRLSRRASISTHSAIPSQGTTNKQKQPSTGQPLSTKERNSSEPQSNVDASTVAHRSSEVDINAGLFLNTREAGLDHVFKTAFNVTMEELARVADGANSSTAEIFYLHLPLDDPECQQEYELLEAFLKTHDAMIWSNRSPTDWGKFVHNAKRGVALFHDSFRGYPNLNPPINIVLRNHSVNLWNVRLSRPLDFPDPEYHLSGTHLQRIFPHGGVILVTPHIVQHDPTSTAIMLRWFYHYQSTKLDTWKVIFCANVMEWLADKLENKEQDPSDNHGWWLIIIAWIQKINKIEGRFDPRSLDPRYLGRGDNNVLSFPSIPGYGSRSENDDPRIPKGLTQAQRNEDHLVDCFAGWGLVMDARFRRFIVITPGDSRSLHQRWEDWGHLEVQKGFKDFFRNFKVEYNAIYKQLYKGSPQLQGLTGSSSPATHKPKVGPYVTPTDTACDHDVAPQSRWRQPSKHASPPPYK